MLSRFADPSVSGIPATGKMSYKIKNSTNISTIKVVDKFRSLGRIDGWGRFLIRRIGRRIGSHPGRREEVATDGHSRYVRAVEHGPGNRFQNRSDHRTAQVGSSSA
jgi:hypothetical protein